MERNHYEEVKLFKEWCKANHRKGCDPQTLKDYINSDDYLSKGGSDAEIVQTSKDCTNIHETK